jgi:hypothetical protein
MLVPEVAVRLGITPRQVQHLAKSTGIGRKVGRDWQFTAAEVAKLAKRRGCGRPRKGAK